MKKKFIAMAAVIAMATTNVYAEPATEGTTQLTYDISDTWTLTIPATVPLAKDSEVSASITATNVNIAPGKKLMVRVSSGITDGKVTLANTTDATKKVEATISLASDGAALANGDTVAVFEGMATTPTEYGTMYFSAVESDQNPIQSGSYTGTINFSIASE